MVDGHKVLQCVLVIRRDNGQLALPGGIVEPGHTVTATVKKEFGEEALNTLGIPEEDAKVLVQRVQKAFANGVVIYTGYSDDPRNTDNAWLETSVYHFHDEDGTTMARFPLQGGDDAKSAAWVTVISTSTRATATSCAWRRNAWVPSGNQSSPRAIFLTPVYRDHQVHGDQSPPDNGDEKSQMCQRRRGPHMDSHDSTGRAAGTHSVSTGWRCFSRAPGYRSYRR